MKAGYAPIAAVAITLLVFSSALHSTMFSPAYSDLRKYSSWLEAPRPYAGAEIKKYVPTCQFVEKGEITLASTSDVRFKDSLETSRQALDAVMGLDEAVRYVLDAINSFFRNLGSAGMTIPGDAITAFVGGMTRSCNSRAYDAIAKVMQADSQAWQVLSSDAEEFEKAYGDKGPAGKGESIKQRLYEVGKDLEKGNAQGSALAGKVIAVRDLAAKEAKGEDLFTPVDAKKVVLAGIARDYLLQEIFDLDGGIKSASAELDSLLSKSRERALQEETAAEASLNAFEKDNLALIDSIDVTGRLPLTIGGTPIPVGDFRKSLYEAKKMIASARDKTYLARSAFQAKERGYASAAIEGYNGAEELYANARTLLESKAGEAESIRESALSELAESAAKVEELIERQKKTDPAAAAVTLEKYEEFKSEYSKTNMGKTNLAGEISRLAGYLKDLELVERMASSKKPLTAFYDSIKAQADSLGQLIAAAKKDGLDASYAQARLERIKSTLKSDGESGFLSQESLMQIESELDEIRNDLIRQAADKYKSVLETGYAAASSLEKLLSPEDAAKLGAIGEYFPGEKLDTLQALGELSTIKAALDKISAVSAGDLAATIQKRMQENLITFPKESEPAPIGKPTSFTQRFATRNDLGTGLEQGEVELALPIKLNRPFSVEAKSGIRVFKRGESLVASISNPAPGSEFEFAVAYSYVATKKTGESTTTEYAQEQKAKLVRVLRFEAEEDADVLVEISVPQDSTSLVITPVKSAPYQQPGRLAFVASALKGENFAQVEIYSSKVPFSLTELVLADDGQGRMKKEISYTNEFGQVGEAALYYSLSDCANPADATVQSGDFSAKWTGYGAQLQFKGTWREGENKRATIAYTCIAGAPFQGGNDASPDWAYGTMPNQSTSAVIANALRDLLGAYSLDSNISLLSQALGGMGLAGLESGQSQDALVRLGETLDMIESYSAGLPESMAVMQALADARAKIAAASKNTDAGQRNKAAQSISEGLGQLSKIARDRISALSRDCKDPACEQELYRAKGYANVGNWLLAFESIAKAQAIFEKGKLGLENDWIEKNGLLASYRQDVAVAAEAAIREFDRATSTFQKASPSIFTRLKGDGFDYAQATRARDSLRGKLDYMAGNFALADSKKTNATPLATIGQKVSEVKNGTAELAGYTLKLRGITMQQLNLAKSRAAQGNNSEMQLEQARKEADEGNLLSGYLMAKQLQEDGSQGGGSGGIVQAGAYGAFDLAGYLPYAAAVAVMALAGYFYVSRQEQNGKLPELEKPPEDFSG